MIWVRLDNQEIPFQVRIDPKTRFNDLCGIICHEAQRNKFVSQMSSVDSIYPSMEDGTIDRTASYSSILVVMKNLKLNDINHPLWFSLIPEDQSLVKSHYILR